MKRLLSITAAVLFGAAALSAADFSHIERSLAWSKPQIVTNDFGKVRTLRTAPATEVFWKAWRHEQAGHARRGLFRASDHERLAGTPLEGRCQVNARIVYAYSRSQAVADGVQVEVTKTAHEAGIKFPVFITRGVFELCVAIPPGVSGQDEAGRLVGCRLDAALRHPARSRRSAAHSRRALRSQLRHRAPAPREVDRHVRPARHRRSRSPRSP